MGPHDEDTGPFLGGDAPVRMAGSGEGPRSPLAAGATAARGVASPPTTPAVVSGTASSPVISRELRRLRRPPCSSGRSPAGVGAERSPSSCFARPSTKFSSAEGSALAAAPEGTGVVHSPPGLAARGAALARLDSPTPARSSGEAWAREDEREDGGGDGGGDGCGEGRGGEGGGGEGGGEGGGGDGACGGGHVRAVGAVGMW